MSLYEYLEVELKGKSLEFIEGVNWALDEVKRIIVDGFQDYLKERGGLTNSPVREGSSSSSVPHLCFIGRFAPFHNGHAWMIKEILCNYKYWPKPLIAELTESGTIAPVLILIRDTKYDFISAKDRQSMIRKWLEAENIQGEVMIIPDIHGVYYGRGVGYEVKEVEVPEDIRGISATSIRKCLDEGDNSYVEFVPESIAESLTKVLSNGGVKDEG